MPDSAIIAPHDLSREFSSEWWKDKTRSTAWCNNFCRGLDPSLVDDPEVYSTISVVFMNKADGTVVPVGITALKNNKFIFQYHPDYVQNQEMPPLSCNLPKQIAPYEGKNGKLLPYFDNLLAEGWLGKAQAGALKDSIKDIDDEKENLTTRYNRLMTFGRDWIGAAWATYIKLDPALAEDNHRATIDAALQSRSTISGANPKLLGVIQNGQLRPANYWETSTHIIKLPNEKMPGLMEYEYMSIVATKALLPNDECITAHLTKLHLREEGPRDVLALERFDRTAQKNGKIHFEEVNSILGKPCVERCTGDYLEIANAIRDKMGQTGVKQFYARLLCQFLLNNTDNHFKNFALMEENGQWKMTPNYDLAPAAMYRLNEMGSAESKMDEFNGIGGNTTKGRAKELALGIRGMTRGQDKKYLLLKSEKLTIDSLNARVLVRLGRQFGLEAQDIRDVIEKIMSTIPVAKEAVMSDSSPALEQPVLPLIKSGRIYGDPSNMNLKQDFCERMEKRAKMLFGTLERELPHQPTTAAAR